ncbi:DUF6891 domain-containing protein [Streptomyces sp. NPDC005955]|uniref:DUF6891 domain-containing protein n=1 Tax=Streptomyces sp. NPDC005955 TaxID=3364738 RepID=UPI0036AC87E8
MTDASGAGAEALDRSAPGDGARSGAGGPLAVRVRTEDDASLLRPSAARLRHLVERIGGADDHFLVVQRVPDLPDVFLQVWHAEGEEYRVEHRSSRAVFLGTDLAADERDRVVAAVVGWSLGTDGWDHGIAWEPVDADPPVDEPEVPEELRGPLEERVRTLIRCGYLDRAALAEVAEEHLIGSARAARAGFPPGRRPVSPGQARALVDRLWLARVAQSAEWSGTTDPERVTEAFAALERAGITAREDFTCCHGCGRSDIDGEAGPGARGYVFFHRGATASAVAGQGLSLVHGGFDGTGPTAVAVGREVVAALAAAGLSTEWDGEPDSSILVTPVNWRKRLVG